MTALPTLRFTCPVDRCAWFVDESPEEATREMTRSAALPLIANPEGMRVGTEAALTRHAATHTPIEYLMTIARQREELERLKMEKTDGR